MQDANTGRPSKRAVSVASKKGQKEAIAGAAVTDTKPAIDVHAAKSNVAPFLSQESAAAAAAAPPQPLRAAEDTSGESSTALQQQQQQAALRQQQYWASMALFQQQRFQSQQQPGPGGIAAPPLALLHRPLILPSTALSAPAFPGVPLGVGAFPPGMGALWRPAVPVAAQFVSSAGFPAPVPSAAAAISNAAASATPPSAAPVPSAARKRKTTAQQPVVTVPIAPTSSGISGAPRPLIALQQTLGGPGPLASPSSSSSLGAADAAASAGAAASSALGNKKPSKAGAAASKGGPAGAAAAAAAGSSYCRKEKSLGLLTENFLEYCAARPDGLVSLEAAAQKLGVERRRIYDVTNILEALDVVSRRTKNAYTWHGTSHIAATLKKLLDSALVDAGRRDEIVPSASIMHDDGYRCFGDLERQGALASASGGGTRVLRGAAPNFNLSGTRVSTAFSTVPPPPSSSSSSAAAAGGLYAAQRQQNSIMPSTAPTSTSSGLLVSTAPIASALGVSVSPDLMRQQLQRGQGQLGAEDGSSDASLHSSTSPRATAFAPASASSSSAVAQRARNFNFDPFAHGQPRAAAAAPWPWASSRDPSAYAPSTSTSSVSHPGPTDPPSSSTWVGRLADPLSAYLSVPATWLDTTWATSTSNAIGGSSSSALSLPSPPSALNGGVVLVPEGGDIYLEETPGAAEVAAATARLPSTSASIEALIIGSSSGSGGSSSCSAGAPGPYLRSLPLLSELIYAETMAALSCGRPLPYPDLAAPTLAARRALISSLTPSCVSASTGRRDRSLGVLTQRFLKLFLLDRKVLTMEYAAGVVIPDDDEEEEAEEGAPRRRPQPTHSISTSVVDAAAGEGAAADDAADGGPQLQLAGEGEEEGDAAAAAATTTRGPQSRQSSSSSSSALQLQLAHRTRADELSDAIADAHNDAPEWWAAAPGAQVDVTRLGGAHHQLQLGEEGGMWSPLPPLLLRELFAKATKTALPPPTPSSGATADGGGAGGKGATRGAAATAGRKPAASASSSSSAAGGAVSAASAPSSSSSSSGEVSKSKVRRLYDIANVLVALKLIDRVVVRVPTGSSSSSSWDVKTTATAKAMMPPPPPVQYASTSAAATMPPPSSFSFSSIGSGSTSTFSSAAVAAGGSSSSVPRVVAPAPMQIQVLPFSVPPTTSTAAATAAASAYPHSHTTSSSSAAAVAAHRPHSSFTRKPALRWRGPAYVVPLEGVAVPPWALRKALPSLLPALAADAAGDEQLQLGARGGDEGAYSGHGTKLKLGRGRGGGGRGGGRGSCRSKAAAASNFAPFYSSSAVGDRADSEADPVAVVEAEAPQLQLGTNRGSLRTSKRAAASVAARMIRGLGEDAGGDEYDYDDEDDEREHPRAARRASSAYVSYTQQHPKLQLGAPYAYAQQQGGDEGEALDTAEAAASVDGSEHRLAGLAAATAAADDASTSTFVKPRGGGATRGRKRKVAVPPVVPLSNSAYAAAAAATGEGAAAFSSYDPKLKLQGHHTEEGALWKEEALHLPLPPHGTTTAAAAPETSTLNGGVRVGRGRGRAPKRAKTEETSSSTEEPQGMEVATSTSTAGVRAMLSATAEDAMLAPDTPTFPHASHHYQQRQQQQLQQQVVPLAGHRHAHHHGPNKGALLPISTPSPPPSSSSASSAQHHHLQQGGGSGGVSAARDDDAVHGAQGFRTSTGPATAAAAARAREGYYYPRTLARRPAAQAQQQRQRGGDSESSGSSTAAAGAAAAAPTAADENDEHAFNFNFMPADDDEAPEGEIQLEPGTASSEGGQLQLETEGVGYGAGLLTGFAMNVAGGRARSRYDSVGELSHLIGSSSSRYDGGSSSVGELLLLPSGAVPHTSDHALHAALERRIQQQHLGAAAANRGRGAPPTNNTSNGDDGEGGLNDLCPSIFREQPHRPRNMSSDRQPRNMGSDGDAADGAAAGGLGRDEEQLVLMMPLPRTAAAPFSGGFTSCSSSSSSHRGAAVAAVDAGDAAGTNFNFGGDPGAAGHDHSNFNFDDDATEARFLRELERHSPISKGLLLREHEQLRARALSRRQISTWSGASVAQGQRQASGAAAAVVASDATSGASAAAAAAAAGTTVERTSTSLAESCSSCPGFPHLLLRTSQVEAGAPPTSTWDVSDHLLLGTQSTASSAGGTSVHTSTAVDNNRRQLLLRSAGGECGAGGGDDFTSSSCSGGSASGGGSTVGTAVSTPSSRRSRSTQQHRLGSGSRASSSSQATSLPLSGENNDIVSSSLSGGGGNSSGGAPSSVELQLGVRAADVELQLGSESALASEGLLQLSETATTVATVLSSAAATTGVLQLPFAAGVVATDDASTCDSEKGPQGSARVKRTKSVGGVHFSSSGSSQEEGGGGSGGGGFHSERVLLSAADSAAAAAGQRPSFAADAAAPAPSRVAGPSTALSTSTWGTQLRSALKLPSWRYDATSTSATSSRYDDALANGSGSSAARGNFNFGLGLPFTSPGLFLRGGSSSSSDRLSTPDESATTDSSSTGTGSGDGSSGGGANFNFSSRGGGFADSNYLANSSGGGKFRRGSGDFTGMDASSSGSNGYTARAITAAATMSEAGVAHSQHDAQLLPPQLQQSQHQPRRVAWADAISPVLSSSAATADATALSTTTSGSSSASSSTFPSRQQQRLPAAGAAASSSSFYHASAAASASSARSSDPAAVAAAAPTPPSHYAHTNFNLGAFQRPFPFTAFTPLSMLKLGPGSPSAAAAIAVHTPSSSSRTSTSSGGGGGGGAAWPSSALAPTSTSMGGTLSWPSSALGTWASSGSSSSSANNASATASSSSSTDVGVGSPSGASSASVMGAVRMAASSPRAEPRVSTANSTAPPATAGGGGGSSNSGAAAVAGLLLCLSDTKKSSSGSVSPPEQTSAVNVDGAVPYSRSNSPAAAAAASGRACRKRRLSGTHGGDGSGSHHHLDETAILHESVELNASCVSSAAGDVLSPSFYSSSMGDISMLATSTTTSVGDVADMMLNAPPQSTSTVPSVASAELKQHAGGRIAHVPSFSVTTTTQLQLGVDGSQLQLTGGMFSP